MTDYRDNQGSNEDWERWHDSQEEAMKETKEEEEEKRSKKYWLLVKSFHRRQTSMTDLEAEWQTVTAQNKKQWRLISTHMVLATTFTTMQLDLGMVLRVLKMKDYGIGKKHYTYEGGGGKPWTATPKSGAGGGVQPLWDALPAEIHQQHQMSKKAAMNKTKMGLAARLRRNATSIEQCNALAIADAKALAKK